MIELTRIPDLPRAAVASSLDGELMPEAQIRAIIASEAATVPVMSGRPTDNARQGWSSRGIASILPRRNERSWKVRADRDTLRTLRVIMDRDPDVSKAVENFILLVGKGYKATAYTRTENTGGQPIENKKAQKSVDDYDRRVGSEYGGGILSLIPVWIKMLLWQGAIANELQMAENLRFIEDMHPVSPDAIVFKRDPESGRLRRGIMVPRSAAKGLMDAGITLDADGFLELPERQFQYVPYHPHVNEPYGMSPLIPVIAAIFFKVELLEDAKMAIHVNGHGRLDVTIDAEALYKSMPDNLKRQGFENQAREWVRGRIADVSNSFKAIGSDESFFHDSMTTTKDIAPKVIPDLEGIMNVIDNQVISGVKQLPILLGRNEGATTTHATVQWQLFAVQVEAFARIVARIIEWGHEQALAAEGIAAYTVVEFEPIRASDRLADENAREKLIANWIAMIKQGWADDEEASMDLLGHVPVGEPIPDPVPVIASAEPTTPAPTDPGSGSGDSGSDTTGGTTDGQNTVKQSGTRDEWGIKFPQNPSQQSRAGVLPDVGDGRVPGDRSEGDHANQHRSAGDATGSGQPASQTVDAHRNPTGTEGDGLTPAPAGTSTPTPPDQIGPAERAASLIRRLYAVVRRVRGKNPPANPGGPDANDLAGLAYAKEYESIIIEAGEIDGIPDYPDTPPDEDGERASGWYRQSVPPETLERAAATVATLDDLTEEFTPTIAERFATLADEYDAAKAAADQDGGKWFETTPGRRWLDRFRQILVEHYKTTFNLRGQAVLEELGIEGVFDLANPDAIKALEEFGLERATGLQDTTIDLLRTVIADGIESGDHPDVIARNIRARISGMSKERAETIARTETAFAYSHAAIESYRRNGVTHKIWLTAEDAKVDPPCPSYEDRGSIPIGETFGGDDQHPPAHPRCVVGDTLVLGPPILATSGRAYAGSVVNLSTSGGHKLTCTPNHPILSDRGWINAGSLVHGDRVLCCVDGQREVTSVNPDDQKRPSRIEDIARSFRESRGVISRSVPVSPEDFHGDGGDSQIAVIRTDRLLLDRLQTGGDQPIAEDDFGGGDVSRFVLPSDRHPAQVFPGLRDTPDGIVSGGGVGGALFGGASGLLQTVRVGVSATDDPQPVKTEIDSATGYAIPDRDSVHRFAGMVAFYDIVGIDVNTFSGHVYNLHTTKGWYTANGIVTHNCRCALLADVEKRPADADTWTGE